MLIFDGYIGPNYKAGTSRKRHVSVNVGTLVEMGIFAEKRKLVFISSFLYIELDTDTLNDMARAWPLK